MGQYIMELKNDFRLTSDFDGVFRFTNATKEDFIALWNGKEYLFPAETTVPMILSDETLENIQAIRKKWAYKLAVREFYKSKKYRDMSKMGKGLPPTYDDKILEPWIEECLKPLSPGKISVREGKKDDDANYKSSKAFGGGEDPNFVFKEESGKVRPLGKMPDAPTSLDLN